MSTSAEPRTVVMTTRELQILHEFLKGGESNKVIARRLFVTEDTMKTHVRNMLRKTRTNNRSELAIRLLRGDVVMKDPAGRVVDPR